MIRMTVIPDAIVEFKPVQKTPPWKIEQRDGKWVVVGQEDGKVFGTHDTHEEALRQMAALYANVPDAKK